MRLTIISGGQTGADVGALRAAKAAGVPTTGWVPRGWLTERGPDRGLADYGLLEMATADYPSRTRANVAMADAVLWFGDPTSHGGLLTLGESRKRGIPVLLVNHVLPKHVGAVVEWLTATFDDLDDTVRLLVAGNRESKSPGIRAAVEAFMLDLLRRLAS
jgi:hypothetical protein